MLAAARSTSRSCSRTQRRSTPHLVEARDHIIKERKDSATIGFVEIYCYYHMRATQSAAGQRPPRIWITRCGPAPAPMRPYN